MKNASPAELAALRVRAASIRGALPPLTRGDDGRLTPKSLQAVQEMAGRILRRERAVGASLVLVRQDSPDETICSGFARLSPRIPVTERTCFRTASVSKLVMSLVIMHLVEIGWLNLDEDISDALGYPVRSPHAPDVPVTLRMLLTHTSGIRDEGNYGTRGMEKGCTLGELLRDPQNWTTNRPGESFHYSNLGAGAAGVVAECTADTRFDYLLQNLIGIPLDVRASYNPGFIDPSEDLADGYSVRGILPPRLRYDAAKISAASDTSGPVRPQEDYLVTAGRLITDSPGMAALIRLLVSGGEVNGQRLLKKESIDEILALQDGRPGIAHAGRGLNAAFLPDVFPGFSAVGHQGVAYGMCAELFGDPARGCGVGVMTSGVRLVRCPPLMRAGFDLLALGFAALDT
ncbi:MAG: serine hydrolase [Clostridia bacterium]|nr:serine hydrolase [Clostridia bacterium]